jgi:hypothetical protein
VLFARDLTWFYARPSRHYQLLPDMLRRAVGGIAWPVLALGYLRPSAISRLNDSFADELFEIGYLVPSTEPKNPAYSNADPVLRGANA